MEQHRVLIVILSLTLFLAVVLGAGLWLFYPGSQDAEPQIAEVSPTEDGREFDPIEYLRGDEEEPIGLEPGEQEPAEQEDVIIVYGESDEEEVPDEELEPDGEVPETRIVTQPRIVAEPVESTDGRPAPSAAAPAPGEEKEGAPPQERPVRETGKPKRDYEPAVAAPAPAPEPTAEGPRVVTRKEYWIQLISSPSLDTVQEARRQLRERTISGVITSISKDGTTYFRLRIGPYTKKAEAEKFLTWVQRIEGFGTSYISLVYNERALAN
jgi:DedD protein